MANSRMASIGRYLAGLPGFASQVLKAAPRWIWRRTDPITKWLQLIGLGIAAVWAFVVYQRTQAPGLEKQLGITSFVGRSQLDPSGECFVYQDVVVENLSNSSVVLDHMRLRVWSLDVAKSRVGPDSLQVFDFSSIVRTPPLVDERLKGSTSGIFMPKVKESDVFLWVPKTGLVSRFYVFSIQAENAANQSLSPLSWWWPQGLCTPPPAEPPPAAAPAPPAPPKPQKERKVTSDAPTASR